MNPSGILCDVE